MVRKGLVRWRAAECFACFQLAPAGAGQAFAAALSAADHSGVDPSVDREGQWVAAATGKDQEQSLDLGEVHSPCPFHSPAVEVHIPVHTQAPRRAALESHVRRLGPESVVAAGIDFAEGLGSQIVAVAAGDREAAGLGTDSDAVAAAGFGRRARVAGDAS